MSQARQGRLICNGFDLRKDSRVERKGSRWSIVNNQRATCALRAGNSPPGHRTKLHFSGQTSYEGPAVGVKRLDNRQPKVPSQSLAGLPLVFTPPLGLRAHWNSPLRGVYLKPLPIISSSAGINLIKLLLTPLPCPDSSQPPSLSQPSSVLWSKFTF